MCPDTPGAIDGCRGRISDRPLPWRQLREWGRDEVAKLREGLDGALRALVAGR